MESPSDDHNKERSTSPSKSPQQQQQQQHTSPPPDHGSQLDDEPEQAESTGRADDPRPQSDDRTEEDPGDILQKLENVDLSEDDTEMLLQEAYAMNRQLKEILRQQESGGERAHVVIRSKSVGSRSGVGRGGKHAVLPPIKGSKMSKQNELYGAKLNRPRPSATSSTSSFGRHEAASSHSVPQDYSHSGASPPKSKGHKSASSRLSRQNSEDRPMWNDRFSYT